MHIHTYTHTRPHNKIIKMASTQMIKNSLQAYFIWRISHILAILFRAEDKIGSDISLFMPFSIWRLTVSLASLSLLAAASPRHMTRFLSLHSPNSPFPCCLPLLFPSFSVHPFSPSLWHLSTPPTLIFYPCFSPFPIFTVRSSSLLPNTLPPCFAIWHPSTHPPQTSFSVASSLLPPFFISNSSLFSLLYLLPPSLPLCLLGSL